MRKGGDGVKKEKEKIKTIVRINHKNCRLVTTRNMVILKHNIKYEDIYSFKVE